MDWTDCQSTEALLASRIPPVSTCEKAFGDWGPGRFAHRLENPKKLAEPIEVRGWQGFWNVPLEIEHMILEQLALR